MHLKPLSSFFFFCCVFSSSQLNGCASCLSPFFSDVTEAADGRLPSRFSSKTDLVSGFVSVMVGVLSVPGCAVGISALWKTMKRIIRPALTAIEANRCFMTEGSLKFRAPLFNVSGGFSHLSKVRLERFSVVTFSGSHARIFLHRLFCSSAENPSAQLNRYPLKKLERLSRIFNIHLPRDKIKGISINSSGWSFGRWANETVREDSRFASFRIAKKDQIREEMVFE